MTNASTSLRSAHNLIAQLARHLASEIDLHNDTIDPASMSVELDLLQQASKVLADANLLVSDVIPHVLARGRRAIL